MYVLSLLVTITLLHLLPVSFKLKVRLVGWGVLYGSCERFAMVGRSCYFLTSASPLRDPSWKGQQSSQMWWWPAPCPALPCPALHIHRYGQTSAQIRIPYGKERCVRSEEMKYETPPPPPPSMMYVVVGQKSFSPSYAPVWNCQKKKKELSNTRIRIKSDRHENRHLVVGKKKWHCHHFAVRFRSCQKEGGEGREGQGYLAPLQVLGDLQ